MIHMLAYVSGTTPSKIIAWRMDFMSIHFGVFVRIVVVIGDLQWEMMVMMTYCCVLTYQFLRCPMQSSSCYRNLGCSLREVLSMILS